MYGRDAETKRAESYPQLTSRYTRERPRKQETGKIPGIDRSKYMGETQKSRELGATENCQFEKHRRDAVVPLDTEIGETASDKVTTGALSRWGGGESSPTNNSK